MWIKTVILLYFQSRCFLFSWLIAMVRTSSTMLNRSSENRHASLVPNLRRKASSFHQYDINCGFFTYGRFKLRKHSSVSSLLSIFLNHEIVLDLIKCFLCIHWWSCCFIFILLIWCIMAINFQILNPTCIPGLTPTLSWCKILSTCCSIQFASI